MCPYDRIAIRNAILIPKGLSRFPKVDAHKFRKHGLDRPSILRARLMQYPGQGELNIWTLLPLDFNHAAINDDFSASYKTRIITCKKQNRLRNLDRLAHSLHRNDRV